MAAGCHSGPVTPSDDLFPPRRPIFFPVVIATVFLTIIGMTAGFVLGERHRDRVRTEKTSQTGGDQTATTAPVDDRSSAPGQCPPETQQTAVSLQFPGDLRQVLRIVTDNGTTVWICEDPAGALYYQGKTGGRDTPLVEGGNGLFLSKVRRTGANAYEAIATNGTRFLVSRTRLEVHFSDGRDPQANKVVEVE